MDALAANENRLLPRTRSYNLWRPVVTRYEESQRNNLPLVLESEQTGDLY